MTAVRLFFSLVGCLLLAAPMSAMGWSPRTHVLTANETLLDAQDGHICLPQLGLYDPESGLWSQIPIGSTPLYQWVFIPPSEDGGGRWVVLNELVRFAPYIRAGAVGPDGVPDPIMGQQLTHVDHSRSPMFDARGFLDRALEQLEGAAILDDFRDEFEAIMTTLGASPSWRSIDWAHEVLREARVYNVEYLGGLTTYDKYLLTTGRLEELRLEQLDAPGLNQMRTRRLCDLCDDSGQTLFPPAYCERVSEVCQTQNIIYVHRHISSDDFLSGLNRELIQATKIRLGVLDKRLLYGKYIEYLAANAFAYGYVQHFAADAFAHTWVNEISGAPFDLAAGRLQPRYDCAEDIRGCLGDSVSVIDEIQHFNVESYVDARYQPALSGSPCLPVDSSASAENISVCDVIDGFDVEFPVDCDYCNPLDYPLEMDEDGNTGLSTRCDHCYPDCNPWRQICPVDVAEPERCGKECERLDGQLAACSRLPIIEVGACQMAAENACADAMMECLCDGALDTLDEILSVDPSDAPEYTYLSDDNRPSLRFQNFMTERARRYGELGILTLTEAARLRDSAEVVRRTGVWGEEILSDEDSDGDGITPREAQARALEATADELESRARRYALFARGECDHINVDGSLAGLEGVTAVDYPPVPPNRVLFLVYDEDGNIVRHDGESVPNDDVIGESGDANPPAGSPVLRPRACQNDDDCFARDVFGDLVQRGACLEMAEFGYPGLWCATPPEDGGQIDTPDVGEEPLLNECIFINCMLSPHSDRFCPQNAIGREPGFDAASVNGKLVCETTSTVEVQENPQAATAFLNNATARDIALPRGFYRHVFQSRRFGGDRPGSPGTWSLGGYLANGLWATHDSVVFVADVSQAIMDPLGLLLSHEGEWVEAEFVASWAAHLNLFWNGMGANFVYWAYQFYQVSPWFPSALVYGPSSMQQVQRPSLCPFIYIHSAPV